MIHFWVLLIILIWVNKGHNNEQTEKKQIFFRIVHQTLHLFVGFIGEPTGQLYAVENSLEFDNGPSTRITPGECTDDRSLDNASSGRIDPHQICA